ncbi:KATNB1-like protein 1 isoform X1 [Seriola dumerili]|uniref:KATNB1-like protein 1 isoform X1 n=1 Tax=Seriola dumerili TaxID=41447 RepID=UPI000BBF15CE|nr:KATNB1-like protein 1 isoform X1 [Seriola dumerili]XP_022606192.1 KATNB1-like protein 1 isoform X1 [Seriola dumerili]XP_022606194.1 KATNB1-like protein 1 isoform X1 [Seriola dumerili]
MDSNSEDGDYQNLEHAFHHDAAQYRVTYPRGGNTKEVDYDKNEESNKKRYPVSRSGNNPGRVKRVVSCKRKTHHLMVARRKQLGSGRNYDAANKENEMNCVQDMQQEIFDMDPWEFPLNVNNNHKAGRTGPEQSDYSTLTELTRDHKTMTDVLFGRNLRLKVALTLWQRNVGELLTYFLRIQDTGAFVDFLPLISKSIDKDSTEITIGCCVDLFPLVKKVLANPYEEYLIVGLNWINSVLKKWWEELNASGYSGSSKPLLDKNFQVYNQQLLELWHQEPSLKSAPGAAGDMAKVSAAIDSFLSQLT